MRVTRRGCARKRRLGTAKDLAANATLPGAMPELRPATRDDLPFLQTMLVEAALWRAGDDRSSLEGTPGDARLGRYLERWGQTDDFGVVAEEEGDPIGAAWWRYFTAETAGYGFVEETVPEISVAVKPGHRGRGVGTALLEALLHEARVRGIASLSLSVEQDNRVVALYERLGFRTISLSGNAWTMVADIRPRVARG
jgi:ribosomal protein S18 acetylase RimI-like enzyme